MLMIILRCWRNCLSCPVCQSGLTVLETVEEPQSKLGVMAIPPDTSVKDSESIRKFHLRCSCCKYDSREDDIELDKLSFLANTIAQLERDNEISYKEVNNLQLHYDIEHMIPYFFNFNPNLYAIEEVDGFDIKVLDLFKLRGKKYNSVLSQLIKKDENLMEEIKEFNQKKEQAIINGNAPSVEEILNYGLNLNEKKYPQRQNLKSRRSKLCPHCNEIISDPSVKASQEHKFFFKCPAYREVPDIKIENDIIELKKDKMTVLKLKFINPLKFQTFIHLNSPLSNTWFIKGQSNDINDILEIEEQKQNYIGDPLKRFNAVFNHMIKFISPKFSIDGNATNASEMNLMEEDEEEMIEVDKVTMEQIKELDYNADKPFQAVYERVKNTTCVYLPIIPKGEPGQEVVVSSVSKNIFFDF
ncbi:hypothetical protein K502DRAFT_138176 [Neoconidiobolus thromboides FSU 785]|nr:hypothetical protein K502DRAFT_138176 [Neoconidiobolus thromboides FSU 785]